MIATFGTRAVLVSCCLALGGCGSIVVHHTPSGKVEETFDAAPDAVKPRIVNLMVDRGYSITRETPYAIAFDKPVDNALAVAVFGSRFNGRPNTRITYTLVPGGGRTRVIADFAFVTNPGSGLEQITPANNNRDTESYQRLLSDLSRSLARY